MALVTTGTIITYIIEKLKLLGPEVVKDFLTKTFSSNFITDIVGKLTDFKYNWKIAIQKTHSGFELTTLKAFEAHFSKIFFVGLVVFFVDKINFVFAGIFFLKEIIFYCAMLTNLKLTKRN